MNGSQKPKIGFCLVEVFDKPEFVNLFGVCPVYGEMPRSDPAVRKS